MVNYVPDFLGLTLSDICNKNCDICGHNKGQRTLQEDLMYKAIDSAVEMGDIREVGFSGGEVTTPLLYETLLKGIKYSKSKGLHSSIMSNASYATSEEIGKKVAHEIKDAGGDKLSFSVDRSHQKQVPIKNVAYALKGVLDEGLETGIKTCHKRSEVLKNVYLLRRLTRELGGELELIGDNYRMAVAGRKIGIKETSLARVEEAKKLPAREFTRLKIRDHEKCDTNEIVVNADGSIISSSCFDTQNNPFYVAGNIENNSLRECARKINSSFVDIMLSPYPFMRIEGFLKRQENPVVRKIPNKRFTNLCEFCDTVLSNPNAIEPIMEQYNFFKGSTPNIEFGHKGQLLIGDAKVTANGKTVGFVEYVGELSNKSFWTQYANMGLGHFSKLKGKRAEKEAEKYRLALEDASKLLEANY
jgi:molybdenum cofactor biosynthesis enzyme MoaA